MEEYSQHRMRANSSWGKWYRKNCRRMMGPTMRDTNTLCWQQQGQGQGQGGQGQGGQGQRQRGTARGRKRRNRYNQRRTTNPRDSSFLHDSHNDEAPWILPVRTTKPPLTAHCKRSTCSFFSVPCHTARTGTAHSGPLLESCRRRARKPVRTLRTEKRKGRKRRSSFAVAPRVTSTSRSYCSRMPHTASFTQRGANS